MGLPKIFVMLTLRGGFIYCAGCATHTGAIYVLGGAVRATLASQP